MNLLDRKTVATAEVLALILVFATFVWILVVGALPHGPAKNEINIVASLLPPYMDEAGHGEEAAIIQAALAAGYEGEKPEIAVNFYIQPFSHHWLSYISDTRYDAVTTVPEKVDIKGNKSKTYIRFQNGIGYRKTDALPGPLDGFNFDALRKFRVVAFAGASDIIPGLGKIRDTFPLYLEEPNQRLHSKLLAEGTVDAVIADGDIFFEYNRRLKETRDIPEMAFAAVFCPTPYAMVFRNADVRDRFNAGYDIISKNGKLAEIEKSFLAKRGPKNDYDKPKACL